METKPNAPAELNKKITSYIEDLAQETDKARIGEVMQKYLNFCASFHNYSLGNQWLIFLTRSDATLVAGYRDWTKKHRYVKKGEKGIPILAPILIKSVNVLGKEIVEAVNFKTVYVFDVTQTDGEPLPETPDAISSEK
ncbi:MAG: ArdC family protein, partial [Alphaproteobacteria bacterium]